MEEYTISIKVSEAANCRELFVSSGPDIPERSGTLWTASPALDFT
jgi:hypothetical protein